MITLHETSLSVNLPSFLTGAIPGTVAGSSHALLRLLNDASVASAAAEAAEAVGEWTTVTAENHPDLFVHHNREAKRQRMEAAASRNSRLIKLSCL